MISSGGGEAYSLGEIERVRSRHERSLMAIEGVRGVAVGRTSIGDDALVVYVLDESARSRVPSELEGYPVQMSLTGEIDAYTVGGL
jgi:hypothetical protein